MQQGGKRLQFRVRHVGRGKSAGYPFQRLSYLEYLDEIARRQAGNANPDVRCSQQQLAAFERANRLAQRTTADTERSGECLFADLAAGLQIDVHDRGFDPFRQCVNQRLSRNLVVQNTVHENLSSIAPSDARAGANAMRKKKRSRWLRTTA